MTGSGQDATWIELVGDNGDSRLSSLRKLVEQARVLQFPANSTVALRHNTVKIGAHTSSLADPEDIRFEDEMEWMSELETRITTLEKGRPPQIRSDPPPAAKPLDVARVEAERDAAVAKLSELTENYKRVEQHYISELAKAEKTLDSEKKKAWAAVKKATDEAEKSKKIAVENGHRINVLTNELKEAQQNAQEPREIIVCEAEQVQAIERLLLSIAAHRASSHGGRMIDTGDQILYDTADAIAKQFSPAGSKGEG